MIKPPRHYYSYFCYIYDKFKPKTSAVVKISLRSTTAPVSRY